MMEFSYNILHLPWCDICATCTTQSYRYEAGVRDQFCMHHTAVAALSEPRPWLLAHNEKAAALSGRKLGRDQLSPTQARRDSVWAEEWITTVTYHNSSKNDSPVIDMPGSAKTESRRPSKSKLSNLSFKGLRKAEVAVEKRWSMNNSSLCLIAVTWQGRRTWSGELCRGCGLHRHGQELDRRPVHGGWGEVGGGAGARDPGLSEIPRARGHSAGARLGGYSGLGGQALWQCRHISSLSETRSL